MSIVSTAEYYDSLKQGKLSPVYLLAGEESYLLDEAVTSLEKAVGADPLNHEVFYLPEASLDSVLLANQTLPFLSEKRLVTVRCLQKLKATDIEKLAEFLKYPVESSCLVLLWEERVRKEGKLAQLFSAAAKAGTVVEFKPLYERDLPAWVQKKISFAGKKISLRAAQYLIQETGTGMFDITNEIEKLLLYAGGRNDISEDDVAIVSGHSRQASLNRLAEALESRDTPAALNLVEELIREGEIPLKIIATVYRVIRRLLFAKSRAVETKSSRQDIQQELRLHNYFDRSFFVNLGKWRFDELTRGIALLAGADAELKTSGRPELQVLDELLFALRAQ